MFFHERINRSKFSNIALNSVKKWLCLFLVMSWSQMDGNIAVAVREHIFLVGKLPFCLEFVEFIFPLVGNLTWHGSLAQVFCARNKARQQYASTTRQNVCFYHRFGQQSSLYWSLVVPLETPDNSNKTEQRSNTKCTAKTFRISKIKF